MTSRSNTFLYVMTLCVMTAVVTWSPVTAQVTCFECLYNSSMPTIASECGEPFDKTAVAGRCSASSCVKFVGTDQGFRIIRRGCYYLAQAKKCRSKVKDDWADEWSPTAGLTGTVCTCPDSLCNSAPHNVRPAIILSAAVGLWATLVFTAALRST